MGCIEVYYFRKGWVKLNTDGAANLVTYIASYGGLIRDEESRWIYGFTKPLGNRSAFTIECWSALCGLQEVWKMGYRRIPMECDSKTLIQCLSTENKNQIPIIQAIRNMLL